MYNYDYPIVFMVETTPNPNEGPQAEPVNFMDFIRTVQENPDALVYVESHMAYVEL